MAYLAIPRKYRPQRFSEVVGQEFITATLKNAIKNGRLAHAYIFAGPRGVGKTTTARIVAKALNCENPQDGEPCNECPQCLEVSKGSHPDVIEVDAATNRGIDQIRELRESVHYAPAKGKKKVYIIDEFHMLTKEAFNALLKTLEEPPPHAVFILATTEIDKIPATVLSRCQKFLFRKVPEELIVKTLADICSKEGVEFEEEALRLIAVASEGCIRDAESLLDQAVALGSGTVKSEVVSNFLGVLTGREVKELLTLGFSGDKRALRQKLASLEERGYNPVFVMKQLIQRVEREFLEGADFTDEELTAAFKILSDGYKEMTYHPNPYAALLFNLYKLSYYKEVKKLSELLNSGLSFSRAVEPPSEKKTRSSEELWFKRYLSRLEEKEGVVELYPNGAVSYNLLKSREKELIRHFGKKVVILEPEKKETNRSFDLKGSESFKKLDENLTAVFGNGSFKIISVKPKRENENTNR